MQLHECPIYEAGELIGNCKTYDPFDQSVLFCNEEFDEEYKTRLDAAIYDFDDLFEGSGALTDLADGIMAGNLQNKVFSEINAQSGKTQLKIHYDNAISRITTKFLEYSQDRYLDFDLCVYRSMKNIIVDFPDVLAGPGFQEKYQGKVVQYMPIPFSTSYNLGTSLEGFPPGVTYEQAIFKIRVPRETPLFILPNGRLYEQEVTLPPGMLVISKDSIEIPVLITIRGKKIVKTVHVYECVFEQNPDYDEVIDFIESHRVHSVDLG
jgi:hypothetical protein